MDDLLDDLPAKFRAPLRQVLSAVATSLWVTPLIAGVIAAGLAVVLGQTDPIGDLLPSPLQLADAAAARSALSSILGATIAATSLVITGTIVALQLATGQYSPRLLRGVLTDRGVRWTLASLVGIVTYTIVLIGSVTEAAVPRTAIAVGLVSGVAVIGLLVYFVHHIIQKLRLETIVGDVTKRTLAAISATHRDDHRDLDDAAVPTDAVPVEALRSGYVQAASLSALARAAGKHGVTVRVRPRVGDFLVAGTTAAWVWSVDGDDHEQLADDDLTTLATRIDAALALGDDRTLEGDPAYGLRHLVDIGLRAVSPGINDPTTAVQVIHHATRLLVELSRRPVTHGVASHDGGRAVLPRPDLAAHFELAQSQLLQYGGGDARVVEALAGQLRDVVEAGTRVERLDLVRTHVQRIRTDLERRDHHPADAAIVTTALERVETVLEDRTPDDEDSTAG